MEELTTTEIWKDVPYENLDHYEVSNLGRVKVKATQKIKKFSNNSIYLSITLSSMCKKINKCINIHRLVSLAFISNPNNYKVVNHIDGNKLNNHYTNLEWTTQSQNVKHSRGDNYISPSNKAIYRIDDDGNKVKYESTTLAAIANNITRKMVRKCLKGGQLKSAGYKWEYCDDKHKSVETDLTQMTHLNKYGKYYYINREGKIYSNFTKQYLNIIINVYPIVNLQKNNIGLKRAVHRLVAETFISNPNNYKVVNHIDGNKLNYHVDNLEWTTHSKNTKHAHQIGLINKFTKKLIRIDVDNNEIEYNSITEAAQKNNIKRTTLQSNLKRNSICGGYKWKYKEDVKEEN